ncbi:hypothetical protein [Colibacter massiliensis]|uniref:hypothetical protein n=1 Tax=Colibacter massiliensis TaxID=1852379 RepID=UPI00235543C3|nr:hypothetical protein [Colibacter massiliensis]
MFKCIETQYIVQFENISEIKKYKGDVEAYLKEYFPIENIQNINIPDNIPLPAEVPVIIGTSKYKHSQLFITSNSIRLTTSFDKEFNSDKEACHKYLRDRISLINDLALNISRNGVIFNGFINQFVDESKTEAESYIADVFFKDVVQNVYDMQAKFTFVRDQTYYINIMINNLRNNQNESVLGLQLDVNSKFLFNSNPQKNVFLKKEQLDTVVCLSFSIIDEQLERIEEGMIEI